jgi:hypothetical protein
MGLTVLVKAASPLWLTGPSRRADSEKHKPGSIAAVVAMVETPLEVRKRREIPVSR